MHLVCREQNREPLHLQQIGRGIRNWRLRRGAVGNVYSRRFGGTAFTAMVTGVLFLVPVRASFALCS